MSRPHVLLASLSNEGLAVPVDSPSFSFASAHTQGFAARLEGQSEGLFNSFRQAGDLAWRVLMCSPLAVALGAGEPSRFGYRLGTAGTEHLVDQWSSADLAFFITALLDRLAMACKATGQPISPLAATGQLFNVPSPKTAASAVTRHTVSAVGGIEQKLRAALATLSPISQARILIPVGNLPELSKQQREWVERGVVVPVQQIQDVLDALKTLPVLPEQMREVLRDLHSPFEGNPYRGIEAFGIDDRALYFGRKPRIEEVLSKLPESPDGELPAVLITGFSGSGKSSLLLAGVLGTVLYADVREYRFLPRPGELADLANFAWRVPARDDLTEFMLCEDMRNHWQRLLGVRLPDVHVLDELGDTLIPLLQPSLERPGRWVFALDQLEALVTRTAQGCVARDDLLDRLSHHLDRLIREAGVWVLATVRTGSIEALGPLWKRVFHDVGHVDLNRPESMNASALSEAERWTWRENERREFLHDIIERPARLAGFTLEDGLLDDLIRDARDPQSLPLLEFALQGLYGKASLRGNRVHHASVLTRADYHAMGGIRGAINQRANQLVSQAGEDRELLLGALARLARQHVDANGQSEYLRSSAAWSSYSAGEQALLLPWFDAEHRLLTRHEDRIEVAHEALLREFTLLRDWLLSNAQLLRWRSDHLLPQLHRWNQGGQADTHLLLALDDLELGNLALGKSALLAPQESAFVEASLSAAERRARDERRRALELDAAKKRILTRTRIGLAVASVLLFVSVVLGLRALEASRKNSALSSELQVQLEDAASRALGRAGDAWASGDFKGYNAYLAESLIYASLPSAQAAASMVLQGHGLPAGVRQSRATVQLDRALRSVRFTADSIKVVATDTSGHSLIWNARTGGAVDEGAPVEAEHPWKLEIDGDIVRILNPANGVLKGKPLHHVGPVRQAVTSEDGRWIAAASLDGLIGVWDAQTGELANNTMQQLSDPETIRFSPDGRWVLAEGGNKATAWEARTGAQIGAFYQAFQVRAVTFSPDSQRIVTLGRNDLGQGMVQLWDLASDSPIGEASRGPSDFSRFSPDSRWVATVGGNAAQIWDTQTGEAVGDRHWHASAITAIEFSSDGRWIATASEDEAQVWDSRTSLRVGEELKHDGRIISIAFSPDDRRIVTGSQDGALHVWDAQATTGTAMVLRHAGIVVAARFSPDGRMLATASQDGTARLWDARTGSLLRVLIRGDYAINAVEFSPDGRWVVTADDAFVARVWDSRDGKPVSAEMVHTASVEAASFSPDGHWVLTRSADHVIRLWDARTGDPVRSKNLEKSNFAQISPDGRLLASAGDDNVLRVTEISQGKLLTQFELDQDINAAAFSPDSRWIATAGGDLPFEPGTAQIWDIQTGKQVTKHMLHDEWVKSLEFSPDARILLTQSGSRTAHLWDTHTGAEIGKPMRHELGIEFVRFSPDGKWVLTSGSDRIGEDIRFWDARTGMGLAGPIVFDDSVNDAQFSADGQRLVVSGWDGTARVLSTQTDLGADPAKLARAVRALSGVEIDADGQLHELSSGERAQARDELRAAATGRTPFDNAIRWYFSDSATRTIAPLADQSVPAFIESAIAAALSVNHDDEDHPRRARAWLDEAYRVDPGHPLILLALSAFEEHPETVRLWRELTLQRVASDSRLASRATEILQSAGDMKNAHRAAEIVRTLDSQGAPVEATH